MDDPDAGPWMTWVKPIFDEGRDTPIERAGQLAVFLAWAKRTP